MRPLKLTKKLCAIGHHGMLAIMPGYVTNGHWLVSRDILDATSQALLDAPDAAILAALGYKAKAGYSPPTIRRPTDNDNAERVTPRDQGLFAQVSGVRSDKAHYVVSLHGAFVSGIAEEYLPVLDPDERGRAWDLRMYPSGMVSTADKSALVMPMRLGLPAWVNLTEPYNQPDNTAFHAAVAEQQAAEDSRRATP